MLSFNAVNTVLVCKKNFKYQFSSRAVCIYAHVFRKLPGCALIGACALIRTNTIKTVLYFSHVVGKPAIYLQKNEMFLTILNFRKKKDREKKKRKKPDPQNMKIRQL